MLNFLKNHKNPWAALPAILLAAAILFVGSGPLAAAENTNDELLFTILHTNDEHSAVIPHSPAVDFHPQQSDPAIGGYARLASAVKDIRGRKEDAGEPVMLVSAGDFMGGSPYSWLVPQGTAAELTLMQQIGYDAVTIGNHEYDYGTDNLAAYLQAAGYPSAHDRTAVLAANTAVPAGHPLTDLGLFQDTHLIKLENGLTVGLFGIMGEKAEAVTYSHEPAVFSDRHPAASNAVAHLQKQGADIIVALTHSGVDEDRALAKAVPGIHVIIGGHSHTELHEPVVENDTVIVQTGTRLHYLGVLELAYDRQSKTLRIRNQEAIQPFLVKLDDSYPLDPETNAEIAEYTTELNALISYQTDGRFEDILDIAAVSRFPLPHHPPLQETPFANFVTDAMRIIAWEVTGERVDFAVQANGSIREGVIPGTMEHSQDKISFYDLAEPVSLGIGADGSAGYPLVSVYLTGEEIYRILEVAAILAELMGDSHFLQFSGLRYDYNQQNAILFTIPFIDQPLPTALLPGSLGAVLSAERYTGNNLGDDEQYQPIERGDQELYHLVTDTYILSFLPMVGQMLPSMEIVPKDSTGNPVPQEQLNGLIIKTDGKELKVWQAVVEYAASQPPNEEGVPQIDPYYSQTAGRINPVWSFPLIAWPILLLLALTALIVFLLIRRRRASRR
ncbi:MAG: bifunctional metallophosphatase/5'-nucleotidase [Actinomycetota bacterium]